MENSVNLEQTAHSVNHLGPIVAMPLPSILSTLKAALVTIKIDFRILKTMHLKQLC